MRSSTARHVVLLFCVAFALRLAAGWVWQHRVEGRFGFGDSVSYWDLGGAIAKGEPYEYVGSRVFRTPGYPLALAPIFLIGGHEPSVMWARAESALFGALAVVGVWWLARLLFDARSAWVAGGMAAVYPEAVAMGALVLSEAPFCPLMVAQLALWTIAWNAPSTGRAATFSVLSGIAAGLATMMRPSWLLFTPFALGVGLLRARARMRQLGVGAMMMAGLIAVMVPWWIRNARVTGRFVPTTLQVGASLYDGLNPHATGASNMEPGDRESQRFVEKQRLAADDNADGALEYRLDRHLRAESVGWARAHPGRVVALMGIKLVR
ncbi:MAG: ArnT family glycosyltransferase, partial [Planctomycetota bacterium]